jgi:hypothetical protein
MTAEAGLAEAKKFSHKMVHFKDSALGNDARSSWECSRCGAFLIVYYRSTVRGGDEVIGADGSAVSRRCRKPDLFK